MPSARLAIVTPVYDDWESFRELIRRLDVMAGAKPDTVFDVIAVDDGSTEPLPGALLADAAIAHLARVDVLRLACNLGHQRAIALGLVEVEARGTYEAVIVMDSDGEDRPEDIPMLLAALRAHPRRVIVARRARRSEGPVF